MAPDKFKRSLSAREVAAYVAAGLHERAPGLDVRQLPVADGGDGTLDAAVSAGFRRLRCEPPGRRESVHTAYAERDGTAVVELADVSGLGRLPGGRLEPLHASSYGTGQVIRAALDAGAHTIVLGVGGSACTDGGAGLVQALGARLLDEHGARLLDEHGAELPPGGAALARLERVELGTRHDAGQPSSTGPGRQLADAPEMTSHRALPRLAAAPRRHQVVIVRAARR